MSILRSLAWVILGKGAKFVFTFLTLFLITNTILVEEYGAYQSLLSFLIILFVVFDLGLNQTMVKLISMTKKKGGIVRKSIGLKMIFLTVSISLSAVLKPFLPALDNFDILFYLMLFGYAIQSMGILMNEVLRALKRFYEYAIVSSSVNLFYLLSLMLLFSLRTTTTEVGIAYLVSSTAYLLVNIFFLKKNRIQIRPRLSGSKKLITQTIPLGMYQILNNVAANIDVMIILSMVSIHAVGMYRLAVEVNNYFLIITSSGSLMLLPYLGEIKSNNDTKRMKELVKSFTKLFCLLGVLLYVFSYLFAGVLLPVLFPNYAGAYLAVIILIVKTCIVYSGVTFESILLVHNRQKMLPKLSLASLIILVGLDLFLIPEYSYNGAAAAALIAALSLNTISCIYVKSNTGMPILKHIGLYYLLIGALVSLSMMGITQFMIGLLAMALVAIMQRNRIFSEQERGIIRRVLHQVARRGRT